MTPMPATKAAAGRSPAASQEFRHGAAGHAFDGDLHIPNAGAEEAVGTFDPSAVGRRLFGP